MRKTLLVIGLVGLVAVGLLAVATNSTVWAQEGTPPATAQPAPLDMRHGRGHGGKGYGLGGEVGLEAAAKALGMTSEDLSTQLWGGKTLADLAEEAGVKLADVRKAVEDAQLAATKAAIEQAVTDGKMSRAQADWLLEGLDQGYWDGRGKGGPGGCGGRGGFKLPRGKGTPGGTRSAPDAPATGTDL